MSRCSRTARGGAARTMRPAPWIAASAVGGAWSINPRWCASVGPRPDGVHAASRLRAPAARRALAIDPPISPRPTNAIRSGRSSAAARRAPAPSALVGSAVMTPPALLSPFRGPPLDAIGRPGSIRWVLAAMRTPPVAGFAAVRIEPRATAWAAPLFSEEGLERSGRVDLAAARSTHDGGHPIDRSRRPPPDPSALERGLGDRFVPSRPAAEKASVEHDPLGREWRLQRRCRGDQGSGSVRRGAKPIGSGDR
jgi:hypothetical protein